MITETDVCLFTIGVTSAAVFAARCAEGLGIRPLEGVVSCVIQESCMYSGVIAGHCMSKGCSRKIEKCMRMIVGLWLGIAVGIFAVEAAAGALNFSTTSLSNPQYMAFASLAGFVSTLSVAYFL